MLAIFDLDGTLLNTIADLAEAANHALKRAGYPTHSLAAYPFFVGNGVTRLLQRVLPEDARDAATVERVREYFMEYYGAHLTTHTEPYPGINELLCQLSEAGVNLAVASNKYQQAVDLLIEHYFPFVKWADVRGQRDSVPVKPDPSIVFGILSECPTPKDDTIYIGDSGVDIETARRAGVTSIGVTWGFRPESELIDAYADHIVHTPFEILDLIPGRSL